MKECTLLILFFIFSCVNPSFAQPTAGQIEKSQQDIEMEKALRREAEKGSQVRIKKIIVRGVKLISPDQLKEITLPFKGRWLSQSDINMILDSITSAYKQNGHEGQPAGISFQIKRNTLEINVEELR